MLIADHKASPKFLDRALQTHADYQNLRLSTTHRRHSPDALQHRPLVVKTMEMPGQSKGRRFGNYVKAVLSIIFNWGAQRDYIRENYSAGVESLQRKRGAPEANRPSTDAERHAVLDAAPAHMRSAIGFMMFCGLGPKDALTLPRSHWRNGEIATRRTKTGVPVFWPAPAELECILRRSPRLTP